MHKFRTKKTLILTTLIFIILAPAIAALSWQHFAASPALTARIYQDGKLLREIDLMHVDKPYSFTIDAPGGGYNTIRVEPGGIGISDADCPDKICQKMGMVHNSAYPISCLPHKLLIRISSDVKTLDAVTG